MHIIYNCMCIYLWYLYLHGFVCTHTVQLHICTHAWCLYLYVCAHDLHLYTCVHVLFIWTHVHVCAFCLPPHF